EKREQRKKLATQKRVEEDKTLYCANLPEQFCKEFETQFLKNHFCVGKTGTQKYSKALSAWSYAKRLIVKIGTEPTDWADEPRVIYNYFAEQETSPEYVSKVLRILN